MIKYFRRVLSALLIISVIFICSAIFLRALFPCRHIETVSKYCDKFDVDINLAMALIKAESNFNKNAVSHADAKGIMQITDDTFDFCNDWLKITDADIFSPEDNIRAGVWYLSYLLNRYDGDITNAVAAYNAGASNVDKWLKDSRYSENGKSLSYIPYEETRLHTDKIRRYKAIYNFLY